MDPDFFKYESIMLNPKRMLQQTFDASGTLVHQGLDDDPLTHGKPGFLTYEILHTGGFMKLYQKPLGRLYWHAQAMAQFRVPDWKLHVSIASPYLAQAWNIVSALFITHGVKSGMKIEVQGDSWPERQHGREITVYIYRFDPSFETHLPGVLSPDLEQSREFWLAFAHAINMALKNAGVKSAGLADGDYPINEFVSLRNEAFVEVRREWGLDKDWDGWDAGKLADQDQFVYPPNVAGYNGAQHSNNPLFSDPPVHLLDKKASSRWFGGSRARRFVVFSSNTVLWSIYLMSVAFAAARLARSSSSSSS